jgi:hypothetical protein
MLNRLLFCIAMATTLLLPGCGGGGTTPVTSTEAPAFVPASQIATLGTAGGSVSLTAPDGTLYTLAVPAGALAKDTALSLTTAAPGEGQRFRVVAGPDGLVFQGGLAATLIIRLPAGRELPAAGGLIYNGSPVQSTRNADGSIVLPLYQFSGSAVAKAGLAQLAQVLERLRPASTVAGSVLVCRSPNVNGGPEAGTASYDALDLASHLDCATAQIEDAVAADNFRGAAALALSLDALFQRASLTGSSFLDRAKSLVCEGRQRALDTLTSVTITDLKDLQVIDRVAQWDMFAQKLGHVCPGQPSLNAAVQPKIDDALTLMDVDPANISAADVSSSGYVEFKDSVDRTLQLRHRLVAIARSLGRPIAPVAPAGVRERAQAANDYNAEALASAQLQGRVEPAALKNLLPAPWVRCRNAGDFAPLMALVDLYGPLDTLKSAAQYCGTQLAVEVLDNQNVSTQTLNGLGGVAAGRNQTTGSGNVTADGVIKLTGPINALRCPANVPSSEELVVRFAGVQVHRLSVAPYLSSALQFNISDLRAAASLANGNTDPQPLTIERTGAACSAYWGAAPVPLLAMTLSFKNPGQLMYASIAGVTVMNADGTGARVAFPVEYGTFWPQSWSPDNLHWVVMGAVRSNSVIRVVDSATGAVHDLTSGSSLYGDDYAAWSPDGTKIAFTRMDYARGPGQIMVMNADSTGLVTVATNPNGMPYHAVRWLPDGKSLAFMAVSPSGAFDGIFVANLSGGGGRLNALSTDTDNMPSWSADGTKMAFVRVIRRSGSPNENLLMVANSDGSGARSIRTLNYPGTTVGTTCWLPDSQRIAFTDYDFVRQVNTVATIKSDGSGVTVVAEGVGIDTVSCSR